MALLIICMRWSVIVYYLYELECGNFNYWYELFSKLEFGTVNYLYELKYGTVNYLYEMECDCLLFV